MRAHFTKILNKWKQDLMQEVDRTVDHMKDEAANFPDPADRASQEEEFSLELRARDRERKLIKKNRQDPAVDRRRRIRLVRVLRHRDRHSPPGSPPDSRSVHRLQDPGGNQGKKQVGK
nr:hypothetical protein GCM10020185_46570 [Pseudomonas brassicacearum subsp. brassicacearum]